MKNKLTAEQQLRQDYEAFEKGLEFIWGVPSHMSVSDTASLHSVNALDIVYDKQKDIYRLSMDSGYEPSNEELLKHYECLLSCFTEFMRGNYYIDDLKFPMSQVLHTGLFLGGEYKTIQEAYITFDAAVYAMRCLHER